MCIIFGYKVKSMNNMESFNLLKTKVTVREDLFNIKDSLHCVSSLVWGRVMEGDICRIGNVKKGSLVEKVIKVVSIDGKRVNFDLVIKTSGEGVLITGSGVYTRDKLYSLKVNVVNNNLGEGGDLYEISSESGRGITWNNYFKFINNIINKHFSLNLN